MEEKGMGQGGRNVEWGRGGGRGRSLGEGKG